MKLFSITEDHRLLLPEQLTSEQFSQMPLPEHWKLPAVLEVDAQNLQNCDSVGLAFLVYLVKQARKSHSQIRWKNIPDSLTKLLELYELNQEGFISDAGRNH